MDRIILKTFSVSELILSMEKIVGIYFKYIFIALCYLTSLLIAYVPKYNWRVIEQKSDNIISFEYIFH